ncbi:MAG: SecD/SecF fusion protein [Planctomycetota bacterium]|jgi:SecD/SecF fusion protein
MVENVSRKIALIAVLLTASLALLLLKDKPFNLGLDLAGGTRLTYSLDLDRAVEEGTISQQEANDPLQLLQATIAIIKDRVDPTGVREVVVRSEGNERFVVELPGTLTMDKEPLRGTLGQDLDLTAAGFLLVSEEFGSSLPVSGYLQIGSETIVYGGKWDTLPEGNRPPAGTLTNVSRAQRNSTATAHTSGEAVVQVINDPILEAITSLGELSFQIQAMDQDFTDLDLTAEREKLRSWVTANEGDTMSSFNKITTADGGPHPGIEWYPNSFSGNEAFTAMSTEERINSAMPVLRPTGEDDTLRGEHLDRVYPSSDQYGYPAVGFIFKAVGGKDDDFTNFTESNVERNMAIVLNGEVYTAPTINGTLYGGGIIQGRFSDEEMQNLVNVLRSGSLRIEPRLEDEIRVGATLGESYVRRGMISGIIAVASVLIFMVVYYRKLGIYSAISMLLAFVMLMGGLSFLDATMTLPGIAGILLTVGMAVDANILIFDRIREETDKGRNIKQACKTGFDKATSAILDANITTMLTAVILYRVGTGPVRGFAVTLMIGIATSVFAALVITRLLVHFSLEKGKTTEFKIGTWMVKASYDFLGKWRAALALSAVLIVGGVGLFIVYPSNEKFGIDFLGGGEVQIRTEVAMTQQDVEAAVGAITESDIGRTASVRSISDSEVGDGEFTHFQIAVKMTADERDVEDGDESDGASALRAIISRELSDILLPDGVQVIGARAPIEGQASQETLDLRLVFDDFHPTADIQTQLTDVALLATATVTEDPSTDGSTYLVSATVATASTNIDVIERVRIAFRNTTDSSGGKFTLATAIPSSASVGAQVVGELRDKAILAILVSLFAIVLYIRVRFTEYAYGFAAVAALTHDVLITLGALTIANHFNILNGEINLAMIAAFLTIIGYSLNDTIVIFDRVRENLPRMQVPLRDVLNASINQTLSRTVLTSGTTLIAVSILFFWNLGTGNVLESFSFAMMIGVITGTYSTIFIANPVLLWLEGKARARRKRNSHGENEAPAVSEKTVAGV